MSYLVATAVFTTGCGFSASVAAKVRSRAAFEDFASAVVGLTSVSARSARRLAGAAVAAEAAVLVTTAVPATSGLGLTAAALLLTAFCAVLVRAVRRGAQTSCHCFGSGGDPVAWRHVGRAAALLVVAAAGAVGATAAPTAPYHATSSVGLMVCAACALLAVAALARLDDMLWLFAPRTGTGRSRAGSGR